MIPTLVPSTPSPPTAFMDNYTGLIVLTGLFSFFLHFSFSFVWQTKLATHQFFGCIKNHHHYRIVLYHICLNISCFLRTTELLTYLNQCHKPQEVSEQEVQCVDATIIASESGKKYVNCQSTTCDTHHSATNEIWTPLLFLPQTMTDWNDCTAETVQSKSPDNAIKEFNAVLVWHHHYSIAITIIIDGTHHSGTHSEICRLSAQAGSPILGSKIRGSQLNSSMPNAVIKEFCQDPMILGCRIPAKFINPESRDWKTLSRDWNL